jgi:hypothetical protein
VRDNTTTHWQDALPQAITALGLTVVSVSDAIWMTVLEGVNKRTLPVSLSIKERSLVVTAFLSAPPDEGHAEVYRLLLSRNQHASLVHYALDDSGQLVINGRIPLVVLDDYGVDAVLGAVLSLADDVFPAVLARGFASYIAAEQQWRANVGLPANPIGGDTP